MNDFIARKIGLLTAALSEPNNLLLSTPDDSLNFELPIEDFAIGYVVEIPIAETQLLAAAAREVDPSQSNIVREGDPFERPA